MRPSKEKKESQIAHLVNHNLTLLKSLIDHGDPIQPWSSTATSHLARFKLWSASLSAHRSFGTRSLEYRLRDASSVRNQVLSLLRDLSTAIDEARTPVEEQPEMLLEPAYDEIEEYFRNDDVQSQTPLDRSLAQIGYILDCLLRLSTTISNPAPHDHFESRVGTSDYSEPWDIRHVQEKFTNVDPVIAMRLGKAITMRRHYFSYRQEHYARLAEGIGEDDNTGEGRTTIASSIPGKFKDARAVDPSNLDNQSEFSATSYALSNAEPDQLKVPHIPKEHVEGPFLCPFCQIIINIDTRRDWKRHVFRDLRPYVCLDKSCKTPNQQYARRSHWIAHMKQEHWTMWYCCFGCSEPFSTRDTWRKHNNAAHSQETPIEGLGIFEERSVQNLEKAAGSCPLCSDIHIKDYRHYGSHVGYHLEQLALFSLPKMEEDDDYNDDDDDDGEQDSEAGDESGDEDDIDLGNASDGEESNNEGRRNPEAIKISGLGMTKFGHDEEVNLSSSDSETSGSSDGNSKPKPPESAPGDYPNSGIQPTPSGALPRAVAEETFDFTPGNYQKPMQLKTEEEQKWERSVEAKQIEIEARIREETERAFKAKMEERDKQEQLLEKEKEKEEAIARYKELEEASQAAEKAGKDLLGEGSIATEEHVEEEAAGTEMHSQESRNQIEAELKADEEYRKKETEMAAAAEAVAKAKLGAAIKAKEEAEEAAKNKMAKEAKWRELLEEEAKLKAENEARAKIEAERKPGKREALKKAVLEEIKQERQLSKRLKEEARLKDDKEAGQLGN